MAQRHFYDEFDAAERTPTPPSNYTATSIESAESMRIPAGTIRAKVFETIARRGARGATRDELSELLGLGIQTICGRCNELLKVGHIVDSGRVRASRSGRNQVVLVSVSCAPASEF